MILHYALVSLFLFSAAVTITHLVETDAAKERRLLQRTKDLRADRIGDAGALIIQIAFLWAVLR